MLAGAGICPAPAPGAALCTQLQASPSPLAVVAEPRADNARPLDAELLAVELQNQRLEDELFKLKIQRDKRRADEGRLVKAEWMPRRAASQWRRPVRENVAFTESQQWLLE